MLSPRDLSCLDLGRICHKPFFKTLKQPLRLLLPLTSLGAHQAHHSTDQAPPSCSLPCCEHLWPTACCSFKARPWIANTWPKLDFVKPLAWRIDTYRSPERTQLALKISPLILACPRKVRPPEAGSAGRTQDVSVPTVSVPGSLSPASSWCSSSTNWAAAQRGAFDARQCLKLSVGVCNSVGCKQEGLQIRPLTAA